MQLSERQMVQIMRRGRRDPVWFVEAILGQEPFQYQCDWLEALKDHPKVAIRTCHGPGKSRFAGGMAVPWFVVCHPNSETVTTAPTYRQVVKILWKEIKRARVTAKVPLGGHVTKTEWVMDQDPYVSTDWTAAGFTANDPNRFQGLHSKSGHLFVVGDEAAGIPDEIYDEGIASIMSGAGSKLLLIGNPTSVTGEFRRACMKEEAGYRRFKISALQTPNFQHFGITLSDLKSGDWVDMVAGQSMPYPWLVTPEWAADRLRKWGASHPMFRARVEAVFPSTGAKSLIPHWAIEEAIERDLKPQGEQRWAVDPGGEGPDPSILGCAWRSGRYRQLYQESKTDLETLAKKIAASARANKTKPIAINVDNVGLGLGVYQGLKRQIVFDEKRNRKVPVCAANGGMQCARKSDREAFANERARWYWNLRRVFDEGRADIDPNDEGLIEELQELQFEVTDSGKIQIESKKKYRARTGKSPDKADTMCYSFAKISDQEIKVVSI